MDLFEAIEQRRAVRKFDPHHEIDEAQVMELFRLTMLSPTAFNMQNWRFLWLRDREKRQELAGVFRNGEMVKNASLLVLILADLRAWEKSPERYCAQVPEEARSRIVAGMDHFYRDDPSRQRDEAMRSGGMAAQTLMLAARGMGLDSCPMIGFDFSAAANLVNLPHDHCIVMAVVIGRKLESPPPRTERLALNEVVIIDGFPGLIQEFKRDKQ
ncbi:MAG: nitroreductase family protein [Magnetococcales bacterium]|nr:nitroreductase family protein [Magnetococcales bacterium]